MKKFKEKRAWFVLAGVILLFGLGFLFYQQTRTRVRGIVEDPQAQQTEEPMVVVEKTETGETREIMMEEYVAGVVAGELKGKEWPLDVFAAQAILARTFAMELMERSGGSISTDVEEAQAYDSEAVTDTIRQAIEKTRGEVVLHGDDYVRAWFHSSAGGHTTLARVGLAFDKEEPPYTTAVESPDQYAPEDERNWEASFTEGEIQQALREEGVENVGSIEEIKMLEEDESGRPLDLKIIHQEGEEILRAADFRISIGADELLSTRFEEIERNEEGFVFRGQGWGHGVGMSQWGAYALAKEGKSPEEIIEHYFDRIDIVHLWE